VDLGAVGRVSGYVLSAALDVGIFLVAFRILTDRDVTTRDVLPGALVSGIAFFVLQELSTLIISRYLQNAQSTYGHFATVITILWWFYLQSIITMLGAQLNVVLKKHSYPRSLTGSLQGEADGRTSPAAERARDEPLAPQQHE
jgi:YihY family inner membrane protein